MRHVYRITRAPENSDKTSVVGEVPANTGEFTDPTLMTAFGRSGEGVFVLPSAIEDRVCKEYDVEVVGRTDAVRSSLGRRVSPS